MILDLAYSSLQRSAQDFRRDPRSHVAGKSVSGCFIGVADAELACHLGSKPVSEQLYVLCQHRPLIYDSTS